MLSLELVCLPVRISQGEAPVEGPSGFSCPHWRHRSGYGKHPGLLRLVRAVARFSFLGEIEQAGERGGDTETDRGRVENHRVAVKHSSSLGCAHVFL